MKRKLIQLSPTTLVVSLPSSWVRKHKLKKGVELNLSEVENTILVSTEETTQTKKEITIDIRPYSDDLAFTYCDAAYIAGYDTITFLTEPRQVQDIIVWVANEVPGMIIKEQTPTKTVFIDITGKHEENIDELVNRILHLIVSMSKEAEVFSKEKNYLGLKQIKKQDYLLGSYVSYALRLLNKYGYNNFNKTGIITTYLKLLETYADGISQLAKTMSKTKQVDVASWKKIVRLSELIRKIHYEKKQKDVLEFEQVRQSLESTKQSLHEQLQIIRSDVRNLFEVEVQLHL